MSRQQILLVIVACLLVFRFGVVPLNEYVDEKKQKIQTLEERVKKGRNLIREVELMLTQEAEIDNRLRQAKEQFEIVTSAEQARFDFQQLLEEKAQKELVDIQSLEWSGDVSGVPSSSLLKISYKAKFHELMKFHSDIKNLGYGLITSDFQMTVQRQLLSRKRLGNVSGDISLRIFYLVDDE